MRTPEDDSWDEFYRARMLRPDWPPDFDWIIGNPKECTHPWRHTVYGSDDPDKNGTTCVMCGKKL